MSAEFTLRWENISAPYAAKISNNLPGYENILVQYTLNSALLNVIAHSRQGQGISPSYSGNVIEYLFHALDFIIIHAFVPRSISVTIFVGVEVIIDDSMSLFSIILNLVEIILVPFLNTL